MTQSKCYKCGGERTLLSRSIDKPDFASHTEDECITHLNLRITTLEAVVVELATTEGGAGALTGEC
jgi:hypothetical protein